MPRSPQNLAPQVLLAALVLAVVVFYSYVDFFIVPYPGFNVNLGNGQVTELFVQALPEPTLHRQDRVLQIGATTLKDFNASSHITLFDGVRDQDAVPLLVEHEGQQLTVSWRYTGRTLDQIVARLVSEWFVPYLFYAVGVVALLTLRPRNHRWRLFVAFTMLTAVWLAAGSGPSRWHLWGSAYVLQTATWLCLPVYLHFHWVFPKSFRPLPLTLLWVLYGIALVASLACWLDILLPQDAYLALFASVGGSLLLLILHWLLQHDQRRTISSFLGIILLSLLPPLILSLFTPPARNNVPVWVGGFVLALPSLPLAYFLGIYRHRLGGLEVRANRLLAAYLFLVALGFAFGVVLSLLISRLRLPDITAIVALGAALLAGVLALYGFPNFQRLVEGRVLGIPLVGSNLLEIYAARITTSLSTSRLTDVLKTEVLPTLLVRQAALLRLEPSGKMSVLDTLHVTDAQLPTAADLTVLQTEAGRYRISEAGDEPPQLCPWIRVVLPLIVDERLVGVWLLGRRDPDDFYAQAEIAQLRAIANQTAIALLNIRQAEELRALALLNISQDEARRKSLAFRLHDEVSNPLALMVVDLNGDAPSNFYDRYEELRTTLRDLIGGLHPPTLSYGLGTALHSLMERLAERQVSGVRFVYDVSRSAMRYPPEVEQQVYRILEQAGENALRHASAHKIRLSGHLQAEELDLTLSDDGRGFDASHLNLLDLADRKHFGLIGMHDRATLIRGLLVIHSTAGQGTQIRITWKPQDDPKG